MSNHEHNPRAKGRIEIAHKNKQSHPDLLSCPFCGAQPVTEVFEDEEDHFDIVSCMKNVCPVHVSTSGRTPEEAAALWNTRLTAPVTTSTKGQPS